MKFTLSWLKDHLDTTASLETILTTLTAVGLTVDKVENRGEVLAPFTVCLIEAAEQHPNGDRLQVCRVNTGNEVLQIVCGAPNARKGLKTVLARPGVLIPSTGQILKVGNVRGIDSHGMMCSAGELLLGTDSNGILEVEDSALLGESYAKLLGWDDVLIDVDVTPNRGDCLGVRGIARDLAAVGIGTLKPLLPVTVKGQSPCTLALSVDLSACSHFTGRVIRNVKNGPSPDWLRQKLQAVGLKSISTLVDITNYFSHDRARPLHVFDLDKIKGSLDVRLSTAGESFEGLDDKIYALAEGSTVIADDSGLIALGGILGGKRTGCEHDTKNVFLESAFFDPIQIATTARPLAIFSDARSRFERGVDPASTLPGLEAATQMILDLCGGEASEVLALGTPLPSSPPLSFHLKRVETLGGMGVTSQRAQQILRPLGFKVTGEGENLTVTPPSWRFDVDREADLVEEILRIEGYDKIPSLPYSVRPEGKPFSPLQERRFVIRHRLANRGLMEAITWSFISRKEAILFGGAPDSLTLLNPISEDLSVMRSSLFPHLLKAVATNQSRGIESLALFEVGPQYTNPTPEGQHMMASGIRAGTFQPGNWGSPPRPVDLYDAKGDAVAVMEMEAQWERTAPAWYHPGRSATLRLGKQVLGYFGELHPHIINAFDLKGPVVGFEIFIDRLPLPKRKATGKTKITLSPYQAVKRDFSLVVENGVDSDRALKAARKADPSLIDAVTLFDVFDLGEGKKALGLRVTLQPKDHTLTNDEIQASCEKIIASLLQQTGGVLR